MAEKLHVIDIPGIVTVDMAVIARFKKQTVTGLREFCDEARVTFIDEVLKSKCPFVPFNFASYCVTVILEGIALLLYLKDNINCTQYHFLV